MKFFKWLLLWPLWWIATLYYYWIERHQYWRSRHVRHLRPIYHYGNMKPFWKRFQSLPELSLEIYRTFSHRSCYGVFQFNLPVLMVRDPILMKQIISDDTNSLSDHRLFAFPYVNQFWPTDVKEEGEIYQSVLNDLVEAFTDEKLNRLVDVVKSNVDEFATFFSRPNIKLAMETNDVFKRLASDVLAAVIFGHTCNSLKDRGNEFYQKVHKETDLRSQLVDFFVTSSIHPVLPKLFRMHFLSRSSTRYLKRIIQDTMGRRNGERQDPPDILYDLMAAKRKFPEVADDALAAAATEMFMAAFDVISRSLFFLIYELAINQEIQRKLYEEVSQIFESDETRVITHETIQNLKYMDMVVSEGLRKWPPYTATDKKVIRSFTLDPVHDCDRQINLEGDVHCSIPIFAIHHDPEAYPEPETFKPERFQNRTDRMRNYLPFATGRKKRFGNRFALLMIKTVALYFLKKFKIKGNVGRTRIPVILCRQSVNPQSIGQLWLQLTRREDVS